VCLTISIRATGLDVQAQKELSARFPALHRGLFPALRRGRGFLSVHGCDLLSDAADWDAATWAFTTDGAQRSTRDGGGCTSASSRRHRGRSSVGWRRPLNRAAAEPHGSSFACGTRRTGDKDAISSSKLAAGAEFSSRCYICCYVRAPHGRLRMRRGPSLLPRRGGRVAECGGLENR
jgi:hypothetical protein